MALSVALSVMQLVGHVTCLFPRILTQVRLIDICLCPPSPSHSHRSVSLPRSLLSLPPRYDTLDALLSAGSPRQVIVAKRRDALTVLIAAAIRNNQERRMCFVKGSIRYEKYHSRAIWRRLIPIQLVAANLLFARPCCLLRAIRQGLLCTRPPLPQ